MLLSDCSCVIEALLGRICLCESGDWNSWHILALKDHFIDIVFPPDNSVITPWIDGIRNESNIFITKSWNLSLTWLMFVKKILPYYLNTIFQMSRKRTNQIPRHYWKWALYVFLNNPLFCDAVTHDYKMNWRISNRRNNFWSSWNITARWQKTCEGESFASFLVYSRQGYLQLENFISWFIEHLGKWTLLSCLSCIIRC